MNDTDRIVRPQLSFVDLTPTTAPTWSPISVPKLPPLRIPGRAGGKRLARGTVPPLPSLRARAPAVVLRQERPEAAALPIRLVMSRGWGQVERVGLDGELLVAPPPCRSRTSSSANPRHVLVALGVAIASLLVVLAVSGPSARTERSSSPAQVASATAGLETPGRATAPAPVITPLPDPTVALAIVPDSEIEVAPLPPVTRAAARSTPAAAPATIAPVRTTADLDGTLAIGAKPPCRILIDGRDTGLLTPQRELRLPQGRHEITLINDEYGIEDRSTIHVSAGSGTRLIRDLSAHLER